MNENELTNVTSDEDLEEVSGGLRNLNHGKKKKKQYRKYAIGDIVEVMKPVVSFRTDRAMITKYELYQGIDYYYVHYLDDGSKQDEWRDVSWIQGAEIK